MMLLLILLLSSWIGEIIISIWGGTKWFLNERQKVMWTSCGCYSTLNCTHNQWKSQIFTIISRSSYEKKAIWFLHKEKGQIQVTKMIKSQKLNHVCTHAHFHLFNQKDPSLKSERMRETKWIKFKTWCKKCYAFTTSLHAKECFWCKTSVHVDVKFSYKCFVLFGDKHACSMSS
jgi:hypothetical protein